MFLAAGFAGRNSTNPADGEARSLSLHFRLPAAARVHIPPNTVENEPHTHTGTKAGHSTV
jgi:hypothetical protein